MSRLEQANDSIGGPDGNAAREGLRNFRRRFYRIAADKQPDFPFQQRNFFSHIMENKEILKSITLLSTATDNIKAVRLFIFLCLNSKN